MTTKPPVLKIILLGDVCVGKTSLLHQFVNRKFSNAYKSTLGADFMSKTISVDGRTVLVQIWDSCGQERFQSMGVAFYRGADCCVLVYDTTTPRSFRSLYLWKDEFLVQASPADLEHYPFVLLGNKVDLVKNRMITAREAKAWCEKNNDMPYFEVSAKEAINVEQAFQTIARHALQYQEQNNNYLRDDFMGSFSLDKQAPSHKQEVRHCNC